MTVTGPDFVSLQVRDLERAARFYQDGLGLSRAPQAPPGAVVFATTPIPFAVREPLPGTDLDAGPGPGTGVGLWFRCDGVQAHPVRSGRLRRHHPRRGLRPARCGTDPLSHVGDDGGGTAAPAPRRGSGSRRSPSCHRTAAPAP